MIRLTAIMAAFAALAAAQDYGRQVEALRPPTDPARAKAVLDLVEREAAWSLEKRVKRAHSAADADRARPELRQKLQAALGYHQFPWPPALNARVTGTLVRPGYRIEKVVYQSLPGVDVAAHLYLPEKIDKPAPAILFYNGHWYADSKVWPDFQKFCINMARMGFVVFTFDPFGQGERGISTRDHRRVSSLLVGVAEQGFAEYESQCALEYLLSRKEIDPERVGMTGASGGGYNTWINSALDDRIKVAVPVVGTSDFILQVRFARTNDWYGANEHCHFVPGLLTFADNRELLAMIAPRPLLIINSTTDKGFPIGGVYDYGQELYSSYGHNERVQFFHDPTTGHGYQQAKREAAYGWFRRWLQYRGDGSPVPEPETAIEPVDSPELRCFEDGRRHPSGPGMEAAVGKLAGAGFRKEPHLPVLQPRVPLAPVPAVADRPVQRLEIELIPHGEARPAFLIRPVKEKGLLVALDDRGKEAVAAEPFIQKAIGQGWAVLGVDPRGIGELQLNEHGWIFAVSLLLRENFVQRQAGDIIATAWAVHRAPAYRAKPLALYARGQNASLAAMYVIGQMGRENRPELSWYMLRDGFVSFRQFLERPKSWPASFKLFETDDRTNRLTAFDREIPYWYYPFDALREYDLPDLLAASKARGWVVDPIDGDWEPMTKQAAVRFLPPQTTVLVGQQDIAISLTNLP